MTRVRIPAPDIEADVSAEQVVAYLLREGWTHGGSNVEQTWRYFRRGRKRIEVPVLPEMRRSATLLASIVEDIGIATKRHPSAVLADIVGPARGVEGARCRGLGTGEDFDEGRVKCMVKMMAKRWRTSVGDSAAHGAGESEEQKR